MAEDLTGFLNEMFDGGAPPEREAECPSCMGTVRIRFTQSPDDPRLAWGEARCRHCHEEGETEERPLTPPIRLVILSMEGTWTLRLRDATEEALAAAREAVTNAGLESVGQPPLFRGTQTEMQFLAAPLRARGFPLALARSTD